MIGVRKGCDHSCATTDWCRSKMVWNGIMLSSQDEDEDIDGMSRWWQPSNRWKRKAKQLAVERTGWSPKFGLACDIDFVSNDDRKGKKGSL